jgi:uncharacterized protein
MKKRVFIVHGFQGDPLSGWKSWLKKELEDEGFKVTSLSMPNPDHPKMSEWVEFLDQAIKSPDENTYLVGHSLGCITILRYLEKLPASIRLGGVVLLAGFAQKLGKEDFTKLDHFVEDPLDWDKIKSHSLNFLAIHSDNDPHVPLENGHLFEKELGAKLIIEPGKGHFSSSEGTTQIPILLEELLRTSSNGISRVDKEKYY